MKIDQLMLKNFAAVSDITVNISPGVTYLVGNNGAGKTTVGLNSVWFVLQGLAQKGPDVFHAERFRFIGPNGRSATGGLVLRDEKENIKVEVIRKLTKTATTLKIIASDGRQLDQSYLDEIFNIFTINLFAFSKLPPKEQSLALGLDTSEFDQERSDLYAERRDIAREVKRLKAVAGSCPQQTEVESVNLAALLTEKDRIDKENTGIERKTNKEYAAHVVEVNGFNREQRELIKQKKALLLDMEETERQIELLQKTLRLDREEFTAMPIPQEEKIQDALDAPDLISTEKLTRQITAAESINEHARQYQDFVKASGECHAENNSLEKIETQYAKNESDRVKYIQAKKLPFSNMTIDEDGGLLVSEKPFCEPYFSKGEIIRMSAKLVTTSADDKKLKYVFVDTAGLDPKNREKTLKELADAGWQVMAEVVDNKATGDNSILLSEGRVVGGEEGVGESL
jgi:DNA repair exonuclease SbcCD ATPase subunit